MDETVEKMSDINNVVFWMELKTPHIRIDIFSPLVNTGW